MLAKIENAIVGWEAVSPLLTKPSNEVEYDALVSMLDDVLDAGGVDESHPLAVLADLMGNLVSEYDSVHYQITPAATGTEMLDHLMKEHGLRQVDLPEVGSQGVISEILNGKRELTLRQIRVLSERFEVPASSFL